MCEHSQAILQAWLQRCREQGLGSTAPRTAILTAMLELDRATDAVIILQRARLHYPSTSLDTTYRFLRELRRRELIEAWPGRRTLWRLPPLDLAALPGPSAIPTPKQS